MKKVLFPGTFDPFTNGHLDIVNRALKIFDHITLLISVPPNKKSFITTEKRLELLKEIFKGNESVKVDTWSGLTMDYLKANKINTLVRGLRSSRDFDFEFPIASMNKELYNDVETIFFTAHDKNCFTSSSLVREIHSHNGDIEKLVPKVIFNYLKNNKEDKN